MVTLSVLWLKNPANAEIYFAKWSFICYIIYFSILKQWKKNSVYSRLMFTNSVTLLELPYWSLCMLRKHVHYPDMLNKYANQLLNLGVWIIAILLFHRNTVWKLFEKNIIWEKHLNSLTLIHMIWYMWLYWF